MLKVAHHLNTSVSIISNTRCLVDSLHSNGSLTYFTYRVGSISESHRLNKIFTKVYTQTLQKRILNPYVSMGDMHESYNVQDKNESSLKIQHTLNQRKHTENIFGVQNQDKIVLRKLFLAKKNPKQTFTCFYLILRQFRYEERYLFSSCQKRGFTCCDRFIILQGWRVCDPSTTNNYPVEKSFVNEKAPSSPLLMPFQPYIVLTLWGIFQLQSARLMSL